MSWFGFWMFCSVWVITNAWLYNQGHDTWLWHYKTDAEKEILAAKLTKLRESK